MLVVMIHYPSSTLFNSKIVSVFFNELPFYSFLMNASDGMLAKMRHFCKKENTKLFFVSV